MSYEKKTTYMSKETGEELLSVTLSKSFSAEYVEKKQKTKGVLSDIPLEWWDNYASPSGGYINYATYQVTGINPATKRKNKRIYDCTDEQKAIEQAMSEGLAEPFEVILLPSREPTDRQLNYAKDLEIILPVDVCFEDVSALISRVVDDDEEPVPEKLAKAAHAFGWHMSRYIGKKEIIAIAAHKLSASEYADFLKTSYENSPHDRTDEDFRLTTGQFETFDVNLSELSKPYHSIKAIFRLVISVLIFIIGVLFIFYIFTPQILGIPMVVLGMVGIVKTTLQVKMLFQKGDCPYCGTKLIVKFGSLAFLCPVCHNTGEQTETSLVSAHKANIKK